MTVHQRSPALDRFWAAVNKNGPVHPIYGQCWVWTKAKWSHKCGSVGNGGKKELAHRYIWTVINGPLGPDDKVLHKCDNPRCVRPDHLFVGTQADNVADRDGKGRQAKGDSNGKSKLTSEQVREIKRRHKPYCPVNGTKALAAEFGVQPLAVSWIMSGKTWRHVS